MAEIVRISFIGDSFVQGVGDPEHRGWVGRALEATAGELTAFNLGVRGNTSEDVRRRCWREVAPRTALGADNRLVISFGSNDTLEEAGRVRVRHDRSVANLASLLQGSRRRAITPLVVGPPPVLDAGPPHLRRTVALAEAMAGLSRAHQVSFIDTTRILAADPVWTRDVLAGDGAHPSGDGYRRLADLILAGGWRDWIASFDWRTR